jgi:hypothetical protein
MESGDGTPLAPLPIAEMTGSTLAPSWMEGGFAAEASRETTHTVLTFEDEAGRSFNFNFEAGEAFGIMCPSDVWPIAVQGFIQDGTAQQKGVQVGMMLTAVDGKAVAFDDIDKSQSNTEILDQTLRDNAIRSLKSSGGPTQITEEAMQVLKERLLEDMVVFLQRAVEGFWCTYIKEGHGKTQAMLLMDKVPQFLMLLSGSKLERKELVCPLACVDAVHSWMTLAKRTFLVPS